MYLYKIIMFKIKFNFIIDGILYNIFFVLVYVKLFFFIFFSFGYVVFIIKFGIGNVIKFWFK